MKVVVVIIVLELFVVNFNGFDFMGCCVVVVFVYEVEWC